MNSPHEFIEVIQFLSAPFIMCLVLAGIHCYLGLHVLARQVIFVDLSLAQIAALGATLALLCGFEHRSLEEYLFSLASTFLAAALFALARKFERLYSQEAIIGIVYAFGSAAVVLTVDHLAHGSEHIKDLLVGQVLWVSWSDVLQTSLIYFGVGTIHYLFRKPLINVSFGRAQRHTTWWDFLFYALFGIVITSSVKVAGVLQVFAYLIVPSIVGTVFFASIRARLVFGWLLGFALSLTALLLSYRWDLPAGAFIVVCFSSLPIALLLLTPLFSRFRRHP